MNGPVTLFVALQISGSLMVTEAITKAMLFYPERGQRITPEALGMPFEPVWVAADDGVRTQAWWIPAERPRVVMLAFHGNAGTMADRLPYFARLRALGCSLLTAEYRGYGNSEGSPSEAGLYADGRAALAEARRRAGGLPVVVWGRSLGGAVAIYLAHSLPVDGLIVESTFTNLPDMAGRTGIPFARYLVAYQLNSLERIRTVAVPTLIVHGDEDEVVPYEMGERLRDAATQASSLSFVRLPGGDHNTAWVTKGKLYWSGIKAFLGIFDHAG